MPPPEGGTGGRVEDERPRVLAVPGIPQVPSPRSSVTPSTNSPRNDTPQRDTSKDISLNVSNAGDTVVLEADAVHDSPLQGPVMTAERWPAREIFAPEPVVTLREKIYALLDPGQPASSPGLAKASTAISIGIFMLIYLSIIVFCLESHPYFYKRHNRVLHGLEIFCVAVFTIDLIARFVTVADKKAFCKQFLNWVDFVSILPFYIEVLIVHILRGGSFAVSSFVFLRVLRLARVFRVFKVGKYNTGLQLVICAMRQSTEALSLLGFLLGIALVLFASLVFIAEQTESTFDENESLWYYDSLDQDGNRVLSTFQSIPASMWWAIVTLSTVGYGDTVPRTWFGKCVGMLCMVGGVLVIAFPIILISNNFSEAARVYAEQLSEEAGDDPSDDDEGNEDLRSAFAVLSKDPSKEVASQNPTNGDTIGSACVAMASDTAPDRPEVPFEFGDPPGSTERLRSKHGVAGGGEPLSPGWRSPRNGPHTSISDAPATNNGGERSADVLASPPLPLNRTGNSIASSSSTVSRPLQAQIFTTSASGKLLQEPLSPIPSRGAAHLFMNSPMSPVSDTSRHASLYRVNRSMVVHRPPKPGLHCVSAYFRYANRQRPVYLTDGFAEQFSHFGYEPLCCAAVDAQGVVKTRVVDHAAGHRTLDFDLHLDCAEAQLLAAAAIQRTEVWDKCRNTSVSAYHVAQLEVAVHCALAERLVESTFHAPGSFVTLSLRLPPDDDADVDAEVSALQQLLTISSLDCSVYRDDKAQVPEFEVTVPLTLPPPPLTQSVSEAPPLPGPEQSS